MTEVKKRGRGRPRKGEIVAKTKGKRGKVGRPKGDAAILNEYKARMLASPKSEAVLESIFDAALNDDHKNQAAAWKIVTDRMLHVSHFEKDRMGGSGRSIEVNLNFDSAPSVTVDKEEAIDVDFTPVERGEDAAD